MAAGGVGVEDHQEEGTVLTMTLAKGWKTLTKEILAKDVRFGGDVDTGDHLGVGVVDSGAVEEAADLCVVHRVTVTTPRVRRKSPQVEEATPEGEADNLGITAVTTAPGVAMDHPLVKITTMKGTMKVVMKKEVREEVRKEDAGLIISAADASHARRRMERAAPEKERKNPPLKAGMMEEHPHKRTLEETSLRPSQRKTGQKGLRKSLRRKPKPLHQPPSLLLPPARVLTARRLCRATTLTPQPQPCDTSRKPPAGLGVGHHPYSQEKQLDIIITLKLLSMTLTSLVCCDTPVNGASVMESTTTSRTLNFLNKLKDMAIKRLKQRKSFK